MNIALGYRDRATMERDLAAAKSRGATATADIPDAAGGVYLRIVDQLSLELLLVPPELDSSYGFEPQS
ncbi:hypothetical protein [Amycolatopsis pithecellobii]|uniref:Glyoxalase-like domain-containing protein n=1 Tax=Amycolatopsis pithecellobii TaxID=664692 RepID=A0A6N7YXG3_9PSEU|nr:hypothetical protein [Amycolatopsis pithecellobii]MTD56622.1 hypothetical protein [Amycolatopsis pithecellobii]